MKKCLTLLLVSFMVIFIYSSTAAQCAMCTKTAQQLGEKPALGLNSGILYLMLMPFAIMGYIAYRWWKGRVTSEDDHAA